MKYLALATALLSLSACLDPEPRKQDSLTKSFVKAGEYEQAPFCPPGKRRQALCY